MPYQRITGGVTAPAGFVAGSTYCGIKSGGRDLTVLLSETPSVAAAVFTLNKVQAAPIAVNRRHLSATGGRARGVVVNSGNANACTGRQGEEDAEEMARLVAERFDCRPEEILVASTGVIGVRMPMDKVRRGVQEVAPTRDGGHEAALGIMTTDLREKEIALSLELGGREVRIGGMAKGSGMIHPNMGTMLAFITTDAAVEPAFLDAALRRSVDKSFNMVTVDGDTSTNDTVVVLANGAAGNEPLNETSADAAAFMAALDEVTTYLAQEIARDGEGASKFIEVKVTGAASERDARLVAKAIAGSSLLKAAVYGADPNWGRILCAAGYSGAELDPNRVDVTVGTVALVRDGEILPFDREAAAQAMKGPDVTIAMDLHLGQAEATAWGCDLTEKYVAINALYTTEGAGREMTSHEEHLMEVLYEALPYINQFAGRTIVIKLGGSAFDGRDTTLQDVITLKSLGVKPVLVHGGGKDISNLLKRLGTEAKFVGGLRVTDEATLEAVVMVLAGKVNKEITACLNSMGARAIGLSGVDGGLLEGQIKDEALGLVGEVTRVNLSVIEMALAADLIPVIAPLALAEGGRILNVNGDTAAGEIAAALKASKMIFLTDVPGIRDADGKAISQLTRQGVHELIETGVVSGGMIPKVLACVRALEGVERAHIIDGRAPHALIRELYTDRGVGTMITA